MTTCSARLVCCAMVLVVAVGFAAGCAGVARIDPTAAQKALAADAEKGLTTPEENLLLAKSWIAVGEYRRALRLLDAQTLSDPLLVNRKEILRGLCFEGLIENAGAWNAYEAARSALPDDASALVREATYAYRSGDTVRAENLARQALSIQPGNPEPLYYLYLLEFDPAARASILVRLIGIDGPNGAWTLRALTARKS